MHHSIFRKAEVHDHGNYQNRRAKDRQENDPNERDHLLGDVAIGSLVAMMGVQVLIADCKVKMSLVLFRDRLLDIAFRCRSWRGSYRCSWSSSDG